MESLVFHGSAWSCHDCVQSLKIFGEFGAVSRGVGAGWAAVDAALAAEVATAMAADVADIASDYPVGTRLRARFDLCTDEWTIVPESDFSA